MKRTPTYYVKTVLLILGFLLLFVASVSSVTRKITYNYANSGHNSVEETIGYTEQLWFEILAATLIIFGVGYFFNKTVNIVLVFVFAPILGILLLFLTAMRSFHLSFFGPTYTIEMDSGYYFAILGFALVVLATCISVLRPKTNAIKNVQSDLLDEL